MSDIFRVYASFSDSAEAAARVRHIIVLNGYVFGVSRRAEPVFKGGKPAFIKDIAPCGKAVYLCRKPLEGHAAVVNIGEFAFFNKYIRAAAQKLHRVTEACAVGAAHQAAADIAEFAAPYRNARSAV